MQSFFSLRVYTLSKKLLIPILIWFWSLLRFVGNTVIFVTALQMSSVASYESQWQWLLTAVWSVSVATDLLITVTLVVVLLRQRTNAHQRYIVKFLRSRVRVHRVISPVEPSC